MTGRAFAYLGAELVVYFGLLLALEHSQSIVAAFRRARCAAALCGVDEPTLALSRPSRIVVAVAAIAAIVLLAVGEPPAIAAAAVLAAAAAIGVVLWERRLRRTASTGAAKALAVQAAAEEDGGYAEEEDVATERAVAEAMVAPGGGLGVAASEAPAVLISKLRKVYPPRGRAKAKVAVVDLSLTVRKAECFGFLGVNGAGKTSTLAVLTGDTLPTSGGAWVEGRSVLTNLAAVRHRLGYCPQFDPLLELMTARETLTDVRAAQVGRRGRHPVARPGTDRPRLVNAVRRSRLRLVLGRQQAEAQPRHRPRRSAGGRVPRRTELRDGSLVAAAHVGSDHRGAKPAVHRAHDALWRRREALCSRIAIMAAGRLQCLGGQQHLKSKYGGGYALELRCAPPRVAAARAAVARLFEGAREIEHHAGKLKFELPSEKDGGGSLAGVFETLEAQKEELGVEDYSASQPTIEDIFLKIAGEKDLEAAARGTSARAAAPAPAPEVEAVEMMRPSGEMKVVVATPMPLEDPLTV